MTKIQTIKQGESLNFSFDLNGASLDGYTCNIAVKQYPDDTAAISRTITLGTDPDTNLPAFSGFLTQTETAALTVGLWILNAVLFKVSTDEETTEEIRFQINNAWS